MKLKKLPGFSLGLIALAVGNAYATQLLDDYSIMKNRRLKSKIIIR